VQWVIVGKDGIIVEVMEVVGVEGSRVLFERYLPLHDTVLKRYRVAKPFFAAQKAKRRDLKRAAQIKNGKVHGAKNSKVITFHFQHQSSWWMH
jgi:hypothetical protein